LVLLGVLSSCTAPLLKDITRVSSETKDVYRIKQTQKPPTIDGKADEPEWDTVEWRAIDHLWLLAQPSVEDFSGRVKMLWKGNVVYVLGEITDDVLSDTHKHPKQRYYKDDCFEIFIDEDNSGGDHERNENAYAYHCAIDGTNVVDMDNNGYPVLYNHHVKYKLNTIGTKTTWEFAVTVYNDSLKPVKRLKAGKIMGMSIAYCDNDGGQDRDCFMGWSEIDLDNKNVVYKDADYFVTVVLE